MGQKLGEGWVCLFLGGSLIPIEHKVAWAEAYLHTKWHLSPSRRLAATDIGQKLGAVPLFGEGAGSHLAQCGQDQDPPPCQVSS